MKFQDSDLDKYTLMKGKELGKCFVCKEETYFIDYCCEGRLCSSECHDKIYSQLMGMIKGDENTYV